MAGIKDYSTTSANNISLNGIDTNEGMLPSLINNAIRNLMKNTREWFNDSEWVEYGDGDAAYVSAWVSTTQFTIASSVDISAIYHVGRRLKVLKADASYVYGSITATSNNGTLQTITATFDSGNLGASTNTLRIFIGILSKTNSSIPTEIIKTSNLADGSVTTAKIANSNITVAKMAANSVDSDQYVDGSIDTIHIASAQVTADKIGTDAVTTAKINADAITGAKIADDQIDSEHYVDGSIDTVHIADSQITVAKMAANSVDSNQYVDGSIDTAHIADSQITSAKIADGAIVNADVNASAAIDATKIANGSVTSTEFQYINTLSSNAQTQLDAKLVKASNLSDVASASTSRSNLGLGSIATQAANNVSISGGSVTGLGEPSSNSDASTKSYVDQAVAGLRTRIIAECASTANVNISNALEAGDAIDGVTLVAGDRVLLKNQSTASQNGLYLAVANGAGAASRDPEHDSIAELSGGMVITNQGSANDNKIFLCTTDTDATLGSTSITYTTITPQNVGTVTSITAGTGLSGGAITSSGTIAINSTVATLDGNQTLTNKSIVATQLTGTVPTARLSGAYTGITSLGTITSFRSTGIDDNADATAITISSAENVGIGGTPSSTQRLIVNGDGSNIIGGIEFRNAASGGSTASIGMASGTSNALSIAVNDAANMVFKNSSGTERMRIKSDGTVGIGTSSPTATLSVDGSAIFNESGADKDFRVESDGNANMLFVNGGNDRIGIANSAPLTKLDIQASVNNEDLIRLSHPTSASAAGALLGFNSDGTTDNNVITLGIHYSSDFYDVLNIQRSTRNVGIGTVNPQEQLDITSNSPRIRFTDLSVTNLRHVIGSEANDLEISCDVGNNQATSHIGFKIDGSEKVRMTDTGRVGIGTSSPSATLHVDNSGGASVQISRTGSGALYLESDGTNGNIRSTSSSGSLAFQTNGNNERMRIDSSGRLLVNTTGTLIHAEEKFAVSGGLASFEYANSTSVYINRPGNDGGLVAFFQADTQEGTISVSGTTVSYNGFTGTHWSRFTDNSTPTILRGTVLETLDEMCDWYNLEFDITTTTQDEDGNDVETVRTKKIPHVLLDSQSVGDTVTYNHEGTDYEATIVKEGDVKHMMSKVSDNSDAKNVYGLFVAYDLDGEGYNDFYVASVGSYVVRIKSGETLAKGDLLQSNGDGTAKVQSDDNIKSSSFAKVLSTTIIETYEDGSYLVPCSLMC